MVRSPRDWLPASARTRILVAFCFVIVIAIALTFLFRTPAPGTKAKGTSVQLGFSQINSAAPQFDLPLLQGQGEVQLNKLAGRPIVINLWASYCDVCREESPAIAEVSRVVGEKVRFLGVDSLDERRSALRFAEHYKLGFVTAYDPSGIVATKYRAPGLPVTFFIARTGTRILGVNIGVLTAQGLLNILRRIYGVKAKL
jgi:thiol-disulfide isomerase/thioredoxin